MISDGILSNDALFYDCDQPMIEEMKQMILGLMDLVRTRMGYFREQGMFNYQSKISVRLLICITCYFDVLQDHEAFANEIRSELMEEKVSLTSQQ